MMQDDELFSTLVRVKDVLPVEAQALADHIGARAKRLAEAERLLDSGCTAYDEKRLGKWMQDVAVFLSRNADSASVAREHTTTPDCWCNPTVDYVDPETGATVYVHNEPN